jgi:hypothetical protein
MCHLGDVVFIRALITWLFQAGRSSYGLLHPTGLEMYCRAGSSSPTNSARAGPACTLGRAGSWNMEGVCTLRDNGQIAESQLSEFAQHERAPRRGASAGPPPGLPPAGKAGGRLGTSTRLGGPPHRGPADSAVLEHLSWQLVQWTVTAVPEKSSDITDRNRVQRPSHRFDQRLTGARFGLSQ